MKSMQFISTINFHEAKIDGREFTGRTLMRPIASIAATRQARRQDGRSKAE